jgi:hypothetical protein
MSGPQKTAIVTGASQASARESCRVRVFSYDRIDQAALITAP